MGKLKFNPFTGTFDEAPDAQIVAYHHVQGAPASQWTVNHNLGFYPGGVLVRDSGGEYHEGRIEHLNLNTLRISFFVQGAPVAFSGEAFLS